MQKQSVLSLVLFPIVIGTILDQTLADERILIDAKINDKPVHLAFDTGASHSVLFRRTADRLALKTHSPSSDGPPRAGGVTADFSEECMLTTGEETKPFTFRVIDTPRFLANDVDGIIGWPTVSNQIIQLDYERNFCSFLDELPSKSQDWAKWKLSSNSRLLMFECPNAAEGLRIGIDTGSPDGVWLNPNQWQRWRSERSSACSTIAASWLPGDGFVVREMLRAKRISLGCLNLSDVPVTVVSPAANVAFQNSDAICGLYALKQLNLIIDGKNGVLYMRPAIVPPDRYPYNRLGAVFAPKNGQTSDDLIAQVIENNTAYHAGIRNGDVLLKIGELDVTKWRTDPGILPLSRFWSQAAGTKLKLMLKRNAAPFETTVTLDELPAVD